MGPMERALKRVIQDAGFRPGEFAEELREMKKTNKELIKNFKNFTRQLEENNKSINKLADYMEKLEEKE